METTVFHLTESLATALARLGWLADEPRVRDTAPTVARGHNLVVICPPAPAYLAPLLAGVLSRRPAAGPPGFVLALTPAQLLPEWRSLLAALEPSGWTMALDGAGAAKAPPELPMLAVLDPGTALQIRERSGLAPEHCRGVLLAWPEGFEDPSMVPALLEGLPKETQRLVATSAPARSADLIERHAWRALTVGGPAEPLPPQGPVRTVELPWSRRVEALPRIVHALAADSVAVWTADRLHHEEIRRALFGSGPAVKVSERPPESSGAVIAFDPPDSPTLAALRRAGETTLLVPPGTEEYVAAIADPRRPLILAEAWGGAASDAAQRRARMDRTARDADLSSELNALAVLFETHGPAAIAAAAYLLWGEDRRARPAPAAQPLLSPTTTRLWVGVGRKDDAGPNDLVGLLANELRVDRASIGRIEVRETYSLIEVPSHQAEALARAMTGKTVRRRRVVARIDKRAT